MRKLLLIIMVLFGCGHNILLAQEFKLDSLQSTLSEKNILTYIALQSKNDENYKMYPTENMWTFLKLDTRTGKVWQVQYSVNSDAHGQVIVNDIDLTFGTNEKAGRFELYPTQNMYNFILLDKSSGLVAQIQWSMDEAHRGLVKIISY